MNVDFMFEYASPWAYLANATLRRRLGDAPVTFVPVYLRGFDMFARGVPYAPAKLAYIFRDLQRCAAHEEVPLTMPPTFPINALYALRGAIAAQREGSFDAYHAAMYRAAWAEGREMSSKEAVSAIAREVGLPAIADGLDDPSVKDALRESTERAIARGAFGVPTFFVGDEMFWGHDRMHFVAKAIAAEKR